MKKTEKNALKNAFGIPEPRHKEEFLAEYTRRLENRRRSPVPVFIKYAAVAAFAVIMISIGITHLPSPDKKFTGSDVITEVTTADGGTGHSGTQDNDIVDTTVISGSTETAVTTEPGTSGTSGGTAGSGDLTSSEGTTSATVTSSGTSSSGTADKTTATKRTTASGTTTARTTTSRTTTSSSRTQVSSQQQTVSATETTTYQMEAGTQPLTSVPPPSVTPEMPPVSDNQKNDYTVKPSIVYYPLDPQVNDNEHPGADPGIADSPTSPGSASDTIVYGTVKRIYYTSFNDTTYTQIDIEISNAYRSSYLNYGDLITVYVLGGFRLDTRVGNYVKTEYGFKPIINKSYLFMLSSSGSQFPYQTFVLSDPPAYSVYTFDGSEYTSAIESGIRYSYYAMKQFIS